MVRALEKDDSVYDFLYIDSRRLALFLSQFSQYGHLTALTRSVNETASKSGGVNVQIAKMDTTSSEQTAQTRQFDTQWVAPLTFLDQANQKGMISRDLENSHIGRLSLVTGELALFDLAVIQTAWGLDHVKNVLRQASSTSAPQPTNRQERRKSEKTGGGDLSSGFEAALSLLKTFPHAILATIQVNGQSVWSSVHADGLIVSASDLMIKHGVHIAGPWNMVGVVDALPDQEEPDQAANARQETAAASLGSLGAFIGGIAPAVRGMLGRPKNAYGMTPLLIFREVSG